ncbi:hypothetical protein BBP40_006992 [Aspergillus hancockii]|nr:hypothetical protein BBP40_006992 [Aspergillus hancockii]
MTLATKLPIAIPLLLVIYYALSRILGDISYSLALRKHKFPRLPHYKHLDPILGLDYVYAMVRALREDRWLPFQKELFAAQGCKTFTATFMGARMVYTSEVENMKAMSTSRWEDFGVGPIRLGNGAISPFTGPGVSTSDGSHWQFSRNLVMPYFDRKEYSKLERLEGHVDRLIALFPKDEKEVVDVQPLLGRWFLDTSTEFLLGESVYSLLDARNAELSWAMTEVMQGMRMRLQLGKLSALHYSKRWLERIAFVHRFLDAHIHRTLAEVRECRETGTKSDRTDLLWTMANQLQDPVALRSQLIGTWVPSNDTTSMHISNALYVLARHPEVVRKLRAEILKRAPPGQPITWELLRSLQYLRYVLNEIHRLYPNSLQMVRIAMKDTTLPVGGGPHGDQPIFIRKGDIVHGNRYLMQRDPDTWGPDAEEFRPERWETERPMWRYVPFGGGPRICPAHVLVSTEASYVLLRILQQFKEIVPRDDKPYTAAMRLGVVLKWGTKISLVPA